MKRVVNLKSEVERKVQHCFSMTIQVETKGQS